MIFRPHEYQRYAIQRIVEQNEVGLLLDMGLGKTAITLHAIDELINNRYEVDRVLVIAPLRVAQTVWAQEAAKWDLGLRVERVLGSAAERRAALRRDADVYVINRENIEWLAEEVGRCWPFDMVVIDELSSFKSARAGRFRALRRVRGCITRIVGLTGTPAPNGLIDLWAQMYLLDRGEALGKTLGSYRYRYFDAGKRNGHVVYEWRLKPGAEEAIYDALHNLCISMQSVDYLQMPERIDNVISVELDDAARAAYEEMERAMLLQLDGKEIVALTAAAVANKLLQLAQGAVYDAGGDWHELHRAKLDALADVVEAACGQSMLVYYTYKHDLERLQKAFPQARVLRRAEDVEAWNRGEVPMLLAHPDSAGHGLNLQAGGHIIVWFGLTWSLEKYQQANARLYRQGQQHGVVIHHLVACDTIDERVMRVLAGKARLQDELLEAVKAVVR
ncbi:SNF2-related protein [Beduinella massiliensis]|uniref:SNF2-related protein n=1 Tax=Beduinella massiliensis TaxID=1852363 RepID=UPI000C85827A